MNSLLNKFIAIGQLKECCIEFFPSHIKSKFNIEVNNQIEITVNYFINKKFNQEKYKEFLSLIPNLHPNVNGYVWNGKIKYRTLFSYNFSENSDNKLFVSGNILEKNEIVYFNAEYIKKTKLKNEFSFEFEGIIIDHFHILNIVNDSPRMFYIENNFKPSEKVYNFSVQYNPHYNIENNNVYNNKQKANFVYYNKHYTGKTINQKDIDNYLLEWNIINSEKE